MMLKASRLYRRAISEGDGGKGIKFLDSLLPGDILARNTL